MVVFAILLHGTGKQKKFSGEQNAVAYVYRETLPAQEIMQEGEHRRKELFIDVLLPLVLKSNEEILAQRSELERIRDRLLWLTKKQKRFLDERAQHYNVEFQNYDELIEILLTRVDVLPASLVLAQAAIESGWGTSRFSLEGNNVFGLRTPEGRGMVPEKRREGALYRVSSFSDIQSSIRFYLWTINTHPMYEKLRQIRSQSTPPYDPILLAEGLEYYSEMGYAYIEKVKEIIEYNKLYVYDSYTLQ
ncbi:MAG: glucosaminidase domain-containing protein [Desulfomonilia bacterium]|nr:glucosaminidase domain-containing protein [Desulfomonilia bacterium]